MNQITHPCAIRWARARSKAGSAASIQILRIIVTPNFVELRLGIVYGSSDRIPARRGRRGRAGAHRRQQQDKDRNGDSDPIAWRVGHDGYS